MLRSLVIRDFVIVDTLELDFESGFTALTGETGAGKSIMIDALSLALGGRAEANVVRVGKARAEIAAEFDLTQISPAALASRRGSFSVSSQRVIENLSASNSPI